MRAREGGRSRLRLAWLAVVVAVAAVGVAPRSAPAGATEVAAFSVRGSVRQVAVTGAVPGAAVSLLDPDGTPADDGGTVDPQGAFLFRDVAPGDGYAVRQDDAGSVSESAPVRVLAPDEVPPESFYETQVLEPGFGYITTRDGTTLSITVRLPGPPDAGPYPTLVEYSGYDPSNPDSPQPSTLVAGTLGYATVGVNVRGTGCSGGAFNYFEELQSLDGYDVIETVAAQPWVLHGEVGMVGISYPGISQLFVAATRPPHLAAIAPLSVIADTYRSTLYPGGIFNDGFALDWARERMRDAQPYGQGWERTVVDRGGPEGEQCAENQELRLQNLDLEAAIAANPFYRADGGDELSPITFVDRVEVPTYLAGAFQDEQTGGHWARMIDRFDPGVPLRATLTNGTHVDSWFTQLDRWFEFLELYVARRIPRMNPLVRALAPLLIEQQTGVQGIRIGPDRFTGYPSHEAALAAYEAEPRVRLLLENGAGDAAMPGAPVPAAEVLLDEWPSRKVQPTAWYFQPDGRMGRFPSLVARNEPSRRIASAYEYDPSAKPRRSFSGDSDDIWASLPAYDWRPLPDGKALAFATRPLSQQLVMAGSGSVDLWLRSTAPDTDVEVTLTELRPDGQEMYVQSGWLRASHRRVDLAKSRPAAPWHTHLAADAAPLPTGQFAPVRVELFPFAHVFRAGSQIRLTVEAPGGNRPFWTFDALEASGTVVNEVAHTRWLQSRVVLPVVGGVTVDTPLPPCPSLRGQPCRPSPAIPAGPAGSK